MNGTATDLTLERRVSTVLHVGSIVSTVLLAAGLVAFFVAPGRALTDGLLDAGLVLLMATPVARVVVALVGYAQDREWFLASLVLMVLSVLGTGFMMAVG